jgi:hypothetical protein
MAEQLMHALEQACYKQPGPLLLNDAGYQHVHIGSQIKMFFIDHSPPHFPSPYAELWGLDCLSSVVCVDLGQYAGERRGP